MTTNNEGDFIPIGTRVRLKIDRREGVVAHMIFCDGVKFTGNNLGPGEYVYKYVYYVNFDDGWPDWFERDGLEIIEGE